MSKIRPIRREKTKGNRTPIRERKEKYDDENGS